MKSASALTLILGTLIFGSNALALTHSVPALSDNLAYNVWIQVDAKDADGNPAPGYCNASLLSAQVLVTAAHCFQDAYQMGSHALAIDLGAYKYVTRPDGTRVRIGYVRQPSQNFQAQFIFTPSLQSRLQSGGSVSISPDEDLALAVLNKPLALPSGFLFANPLTPSEMDSVREQVGALQPTVVAINPVAQVSTTDTKRMAVLDNVSWSYPGYFESKSSSQVEEGDSGAPLLVLFNGQQRLAGVVKGHGTSLWMSWDAFAPVGETLCTLKRSAGLNGAGCS